MTTTRKSHARALATEVAQSCYTKLQKFAILPNLLENRPVALSHLAWMCEEIIANADKWPVTKLHRWLGFIQGCFVVYGISSIEEEKDLVRTIAEQFPEKDITD